LNFEKVEREYVFDEFPAKTIKAIILKILEKMEEMIPIGVS